MQPKGYRLCMIWKPFSVDAFSGLFCRGIVSATEVRVLGADLASQLAVSRARTNLRAAGPWQCVPDYSLVDGQSVPLVRVLIAAIGNPCIKRASVTRHMVAGTRFLQLHSIVIVFVP